MKEERKPENPENTPHDEFHIRGSLPVRVISMTETGILVAALTLR